MQRPGKLEKFAELNRFENVFQPRTAEALSGNYKLKGQWQQQVFGNNNPIVLELGCGKGEYALALARRYPNRNFIGIDIKGDRLWKGAKTAIAENLSNVVFLRTHIEMINSFFAANEVSEIWLTFPDPQLRKARKRLTAARFLASYFDIMGSEGIVHLKTDSITMHNFTKKSVEQNGLSSLFHTTDLYNSNCPDALPTAIQTFYESMFLKEDKPITYISFRLTTPPPYTDPPKEDATENYHTSGGKMKLKVKE